MANNQTEQASMLTFPCGMRLIHVQSPTNVAYCGVSIDAGTRDERCGEYGMAHFCEHLMFKGTRRRRAWHILNRMESVGGDLNAYTNKEETVVYSAFMKEHLARAVDLILDIVFNSTFPQQEIEKERDVIIEEIESYNDTPSELIFDIFENIVHRDTDLGHDILGTADSVRSFSSEDALRFVRRLYCPERMVLFVLGNYDFAYVRRVAERALSVVLPSSDNSRMAADLMTPAELIVPETSLECNRCDHLGEVYTMHQSTHQAHVMMGTRAFGSNDDRRIALYLLNNILGGPGMNSRLNLALREHRGLVYTVESSLVNYTDTSTFAIYFGCDIDDVDCCLRLVRRELDRLMQQPLSASQFRAAIRQIKGQIAVSCDNFENYALDTAKSYLHYNKFEGVEDTFSHLDLLTPEQLQSVAQELFSADKMKTLIIR